MKLDKLPKIVRRPKKRLGQGHGSGKVKTSGRGTKGQKARGKIRAAFEGGQMPLIKRLPLRRGRGRNNSLNSKSLVVNLKYLNLLEKDSLVDLKALVKAGIIKEDEGKAYGVKILGDGELKIALKMTLPCSAGAKKKIEKAGGEIVEINSKSQAPSTK